MDLYEVIQISYKNSDKNKITVGTGGVIDLSETIYILARVTMYKISSELTRLFPNVMKKRYGENIKCQLTKDILLQLHLILKFI